MAVDPCASYVIMYFVRELDTELLKYMVTAFARNELCLKLARDHTGCKILQEVFSRLSRIVFHRGTDSDANG